MTKYYLNGLKIIKILIFIWILTTFLSIFRINEVLFTTTGEPGLIAFINSIKNIFTYLIYSAAYLVALGTAIVASFGQRQFMYNFIEAFFRNYLSLWFNFPTGSAPNLNEIPNLLLTELSGFLEDLYLIVFPLLFIYSIVYLVRAFLQTNPKYDLRVIGSLVLMIVIPMMVFGFRDMLALFNLSFEYFEDLAYPLDERLNQIPLDNVFAFLSSPVILLAILSYIYLEIAFQINYTNTVTKPSLERSDRLEAQLNILRSESHFVIANVDKVKEEAKKRKEELEIEGKETISKFFGKTAERFSYVKEMITKRKLEEEEKKLINAASKTRRLGTYIDKLYREDNEAHDTLTAKSSAPSSQSLAKSTVINFTYRFLLLVIISYIIIHPKWFLDNVFNLPPAITKSVGISSPEVIIILLVPIILIFPVISKIISFIKHRNLIIRLQQEGRIKEILASVGDYVKKSDLEEKKDEKEVKKEEIATEAL
ncbi:MAG: hypothetical protein ACFE8J_06385 [Candidatus Heimdallarchaeota archaeon]